MPFPITLDDALAQLTFLAGIDGKTGANARFSPANLKALLNRKYRALRSRVAQLRVQGFVLSSTATAIPALLSGEDFSEITLPSAFVEVIGVDVLTSRCPKWEELDPIEFGQRRDPQYLDTTAPGFWSILKAPVPSTTSITAGTLAAWGRCGEALAGSYKIHYINAWADITDETHVFMLYEAWDEWFLNAAAMTCCQRDKNKSDLYEQAKEAWGVADALIVQSAARIQRNGSSSPRPYSAVRL
jgi:hypothetical protein